MINFPMIKDQGKWSDQAQANGTNYDAPKKNRFYGLRSKNVQEDSPNVVAAMLQAFSINVHILLDPSVTLSFVTPLVSIKFNVLLDVLIEPFLVTT